MPQVSNNEIPYNEPWRAEHRVQNAARSQVTRTWPQGQDAWLQRALDILQNPSQGSWQEGGATQGNLKAVVAIVLTLLAVIFAIYQVSLKMGSTPSELASNRVHEGKAGSYLYTGTTAGELAGSHRAASQKRVRVGGNTLILNPSSKVELRWSYPSEYAHEVDGFLIYRCPFAIVKNPMEKFCRYEEDFTRFASVEREQRSFIDYLPHRVGMCYLISAYNRAGESKRTHLGCYVRLPA